MWKTINNDMLVDNTDAIPTADDADIADIVNSIDPVSLLN